MSRQNDVKKFMALSTYTEICMLTEALARVVSKEEARFGTQSNSIHDQLMQVGTSLELLRREAEIRVRQPQQ